MSEKKNLIPRVTIENARLVFKNFAGKAGQYNVEGNRNFSVILDPTVAEAMQRDGWNIKFLKPRPDDDGPTPYIQVKVGYNFRAPQVTLITSRGRDNLGEEEVSILDFADIKNVDLILHPSRYDVNGKQGVKAYLHKMYVTLNEDDLDLKYADTQDAPESAAGARNWDASEETPY